jgi:hypothetical protein
MTKGTINLKGIYQLSPGQPVDIAYSDSENWIARVPRRLRVMNSFANPLNNVTSVLVGCKFAYLENRKPPVENPTEKELNEDDEEISDIERRARTVSVSAKSVVAYILSALDLTPATAIPFTITKVVDTWDLSAGFVQELAKIAESECYRCFINMNEQVEFINLKSNSSTKGPIIGEDKLIDLTPQTVGELPADSVFARYESLQLKPPDNDPDNPDDEEKRQMRNWEKDRSVSVEQYIHSFTNANGDVIEQRGSFGVVSETESKYDRADRLYYRMSYKTELLGASTTITNFTFKVDEFVADFLIKNPNAYLIGTIGIVRSDGASEVLEEASTTTSPLGSIAGSCGFEGSIGQLSGLGTYVSSSKTITYEKNQEEGITKTRTFNKVPFVSTPFGSDEVSKRQSRLPDQTESSFLPLVYQLIADASTLVEYGSETRIRTERQFGLQKRPGQQARNKAVDRKTQAPNVAQESKISWAVGSATSQTALELSPPYTSDDRIIKVNNIYSVVPSKAAQQAAAYASIENRLLLAHRAGAGFQLLPIDTPPKPFDLFCVRLNGCTAAYRVNGTTWTINPTGFVCTVEGLFWGAIDGTVNNAWFPLPPGAASLPAPVSVTTNASPAPANSIPMPTLFDPVNPDLTQLFTSLPTTTPPVYVVDAEPAHIIPPYHETVELTAGIQVGAGFNIQPWIPTALSLDAGVKVGASVQPYNLAQIPSKEISITANLPTLAIGRSIFVPATVITVAKQEPTIDKFTTVNVPASVVQVAAIAPDKAGDASLIVTVPLATIQVGAVAPDRTGEDVIRVDVPAAVVYVSGVSPQVEIQTSGVSVPTAGAIVVAGLVPSTSTSATDPLFSSVSLLLPFDGANGSTTFTDSSSNAFALTRAGGAEISTTQGKYGGASGYFDGANGTYIQTPANSAFALGIGDFTVEFYVYRTSTNIDQGIFTFGGTASGLFAAMDNAILEIGVNGGGTPQITGGTINLNTWHHVAITRSSGSLRAFVDGIQFGGTVSDSTNLTDNQLSIGYSYQPPYSMVGYLDDFRVTKGIARYTANFTPPTGPHPLVGLPDPLFASVSLLLPLNGANNSTTFTDASVNSLVATVAGNAKISTAQSKFGGASALFVPGSNGAFISYTPQNLLQFSADFTIEAWVYSTETRNQIIGSSASDINTQIFRLNQISAGNLAFFLNGTQVFQPTPAGLVINTWHHLAICRSGTVTRMFVDGVQKGETNTSWTGTFRMDVIGTFFFNGYRYTADGIYDFAGHIDDLRATKAALYTANFTPPTGPHPNQGFSTIVDVPSTAVSVGTLAPEINPGDYPGDSFFTNVSLLLPLNGANGSTTFTDFSPTPATLTRYGNAQISTAQSRFGGASALFDGSGGYIQSSISNGLNLSSGDFTIEFWARFLAGGEENQVLFQLGTTGDLYSGLMQLNNGVKVFLGSNGSSWDIAENMPVGPKVDNTWVHYALTRSGSTFRAFADGVQQSTWTSNASIHQSSNGITIGKGQFAFVNRNLNAHIDDFRVTKGIARYTANFTPTGPHPLS